IQKQNRSLVCLVQGTQLCTDIVIIVAVFETHRIRCEGAASSTSQQTFLSLPFIYFGCLYKLVSGPLVELRRFVSLPLFHSQLAPRRILHRVKAFLYDLCVVRRFRCFEEILFSFFCFFVWPSGR
uniref:Uncharacterized protein n=1 Tax=Anopheles atroparvus TaxID=41427 RepID=A0AAG5D4N0_ANOAO